MSDEFTSQSTETLLADWHAGDLSEVGRAELARRLREDESTLETAAKQLIVERYLRAESLAGADLAEEVLDRLEFGEPDPELADKVVARIEDEARERSAATAAPKPGGGPTDLARIGRNALRLAALIAVGLGGWWIATTYDFGSGKTEITATPAEEGVKRPASPAPVEEVAVTDPSPDLEMAAQEEVVITPNAPAVTPESPDAVPEPAPVVAETATPPTPSSPNEIVPVVIGEIRSVAGVAGEWEAGMILAAGEHAIAGGLMEMRLTNGVRVVVEGPTRFALQSVNEGRLISGKLSAEVNPTAEGFRVTANALSVVDLGTRFAVTANDKGDAAVHVYDGLVSATVEKAGTDPLNLRMGQTVRLNLRTNRLVPTRFQSSLFAPKPAWTGSIAGASKNFTILDDPPEDSEQDSVKTGQYVVFEERSREVLKRRLAVDLIETGVAAGEDRKQSFIPRDTKVTSYLVQRFPVPGVKGSALGEGFLRFDSPVLGVIYSEELLFDTDRQLGSPQTDYLSRGEREALNRGGRAADEEDALEIGGNRRVVRLRFNAGGNSSDSARIIVAQD